MNNKVQKRKRNGSLQVTFDAENQGHEHRVTRARRRVKMIGKDCSGGDKSNVNVVLGRPPWNYGTHVHRTSDHQKNDFEGRPEAFTRRSRRHATVVRRNRQTDSAASSRKTSGLNRKDTPPTGTSKAVRDTSKVNVRTVWNVSKPAATTSTSSHKIDPEGDKRIVFCDASNYNGIKKLPKGSSQTMVLRDVSNDNDVRTLPNGAPLTMVLRSRTRAPPKASVPSKGRRPRSMRFVSTTPTAAAAVSQPSDDTMMDLVRRVDGDLSMQEADESTDEWSQEPYAPDILKYLKDRETIAQGVIAANELCCVPSHRLILVDWLIDVQHHLGLEVETLHLGVAMADAYLRRVDVCLELLQLVGITCLFIACKYEEIYLPDLSTLCGLCAGIYKPDQLLVMERKVLRDLDFTFRPTSISFLDIFLTFNDLDDEKLKLTCHYLLELMLLDCDLQKSLPSLQAATALHLALLVTTRSDGRQRGRQKGCGTSYQVASHEDGRKVGCVESRDTRAGHPGWSRAGPHGPDASPGCDNRHNGDDDVEGWSWKLSSTTGYLEVELEPTAKCVAERLKHIQTATHKAVFTKYAQRRYMSVSLQPALAVPTYLLKIYESCR